MRYLLFLVFLIEGMLADDECQVSESMRIDCFPEPNANKHECLQRGCCWKIPEEHDMGVPLCFYGHSNIGYRVANSTDTPAGFVLDLHLNGPGGPYRGNIKVLKADFRFESNTRLHLKIYDGVKVRYEVPIPSPHVNKKFGSEYSVSYTDSPFGVMVTRRSDHKVIFYTGIGGFVFSDQFIQISSLLPSNNIYGLGEHVLPFKLSTQWTKLTFFARDIDTPPGGYNLYGSHPFYLNIDEHGQASGVFLKNSNAMDIILQPTPAITYRTIGGILDFYVFIGQSPAQVVSEFTEVVGRPTMPPYWALGFHLCRWGYNTIEKMARVRQRLLDNGIPQDVQWNDIDYMVQQMDFTVDKRYHGLGQYVDKLHAEGMHYILMADPAIGAIKGYQPFDDGIKQDIFVKDAGGNVLIGEVWPGKTAFPDFFHPNTTVYWYEQIKRFHGKVKFDGLWIDMNEPSNFVQGSVHGCRVNHLNNPPYLPAVIGKKLYDKTLCMDAKHHNGLHYDLHSLYGHSEAVVTMNVLRKILGKRTLVVTRSSFSGTGHHVAHWLGDNHSTWEDLRNSISGILNFNLFGIPMVGADICGFQGKPTEELCSRWMQLGAFYPFSRNHNEINQIDQDPAAFGPQLITASREALLARYTLLPYLYTLFYNAHTMGETVARSLLFEFPSDKETYAIDTQFMWGSALLISPVLHRGAVSVKAYLPKGVWFDYYSGEGTLSDGHYVQLPAAFDKVNLHIRGGSIVPTQDPSLTTTASRRNSFGLLVALNPSFSGSTSGSLYLDDGESFLDDSMSSIVHFDCSGNKLTSKVARKGYVPEHQNLGHIKIFGVAKKPGKVLVNGKDVEVTYEDKVLFIHSLKLFITEEFSVTWS